MSDLSNAKQIVLQYFKQDIMSKNGVVTNVSAGNGCIRVMLLKPVTTQFQSVNGIPIEYHVIGPNEKSEDVQSE